MIDYFYKRYKKRLGTVDMSFKRSLFYGIDWTSPIIAIRGEEGVGKTTLMLQYMKLYLPTDTSVLYVDMDSIIFSGYSMYDMISLFVSRGGKHIFLDHIDKYPEWQREIKDIHKEYPNLNIRIACSSLSQPPEDFVTYYLKGLSFREYIERKGGIKIPEIALDDLLENYTMYSNRISKKIQIDKYLKEYLRHGYYIFSKGDNDYQQQIEGYVSNILDIYIPVVKSIEVSYLQKIKNILRIIIESAPLTPNITKISEEVGITRNAVLIYLNYLQESGLTLNIYNEDGPPGPLQKPKRIYPGNTNLLHTLAMEEPSKEVEREIFFLQHLLDMTSVTRHDNNKFLVNNQYLFAISGSDKRSYKATVKEEGVYLAIDGIEYGQQGEVPLWLFGFLY